MITWTASVLKNDNMRSLITHYYSMIMLVSLSRPSIFQFS